MVWIRRTINSLPKRMKSTLIDDKAASFAAFTRTNSTTDTQLLLILALCIAALFSRPSRNDFARIISALSFCFFLWPKGWVDDPWPIIKVLVEPVYGEESAILAMDVLCPIFVRERKAARDAMLWMEQFGKDLIVTRKLSRSSLLPVQGYMRPRRHARRTAIEWRYFQ